MRTTHLFLILLGFLVHSICARADVCVDQVCPDGLECCGRQICCKTRHCTWKSYMRDIPPVCEEPDAGWSTAIVAMYVCMAVHAGIAVWHARRSVSMAQASAQPLLGVATADASSAAPSAPPAPATPATDNDNDNDNDNDSDNDDESISSTNKPPLSLAAALINAPEMNAFFKYFHLFLMLAGGMFFALFSSISSYCCPGFGNGGFEDGCSSATPAVTFLMVWCFVLLAWDSLSLLSLVRAGQAITWGGSSTSYTGNIRTTTTFTVTTADRFNNYATLVFITVLRVAAMGTFASISLFSDDETLHC